MKKASVLVVIFCLSFSAIILAEEGKGNGSKQGQKEKMKAHREQRKSENQAFRQTLYARFCNTIG